jgi:hypothetical protein
MRQTVRTASGGGNRITVTTAYQATLATATPPTPPTPPKGMTA